MSTSLQVNTQAAVRTIARPSGEAGARALAIAIRRDQRVNSKVSEPVSQVADDEPCDGDEPAKSASEHNGGALQEQQAGQRDRALLFQ